MATITLPGSHPGVTIHAGAKFVDGVADVTTLGEHRRSYFERIGATISDDRPLTELSAGQLRQLLPNGVTAPKKATRAQLIALIEAATAGDSTTENPEG